MRALLLLIILGLLLSPGISSAAADGPQSTPEGRVRAFIADYFRVHAQSKQIIRNRDFDGWEKAIGRLEARHFAAGAKSGLGGSLSSAPSHHPESETILSSSTVADVVTIETHDPRSQITAYYEYQLRLVKRDWRLIAVRGYGDSPDAAFMSQSQRETFLRPKKHPLRALPKDEAAMASDAMFNGEIEVRRVGTLAVSTGTLVVGDLGYGPRTLASLAPPVAPGQYPVEVAISSRRVAALRVLITREAVATWHPAGMGDEGGHVVSVDGANVSICDVSALLDIKRRHKEKQFEKFALEGDSAAAIMLTLRTPEDCAVASSGFGDGAYPVYWGMDSAGTPAVLLVNMLVLPNP
jgi:hypothetical protein